MVSKAKTYDVVSSLRWSRFCIDGMTIHIKLRTFALRLIWIAAVMLSHSVRGIGIDADTLLLLKFENTVLGAADETPSSQFGITYLPGINGMSGNFNAAVQLYYPAAGNLDPTRGSLEFWMKPSWAGNDGIGHAVLRHGSGGGLIVLKDGANNLRIILNRFGSSGRPEVGVAYNIGSWLANSWHHVAFTWGDGVLEVYTDGILRGSAKVGVLPVVTDSRFQVGADGTSGPAMALLDELRISSRPRSAVEIASAYSEDIPDLTSVSVSTPSATLWPTWVTVPEVTAETGLGSIRVPASRVDWLNPSPEVVQVLPSGGLQGLAGGSVALTARFRGRSAPFTVTVRTPARPPEFLEVTPELATPATNSLYDIPVVVVTYLPTRDGINIDTSESGGEDGLTTIAAAKAKIARMNRQVKYSLTEGSRFRGYKSPDARPSLGYRILRNIIVYEPLPPGKSAGGTSAFADYRQILDRFGAEPWVMTENVKEVWLWGYHTAKIVPAESNMSSPTTGDISNSYRFNDDLPVYGRTYTLYNYNYGRSQNEAVHNHGHQLEAILSHACKRQDGSDALFWDRFCGRSGGRFQKGRCGNTHFPPNGVSDYDYLNNTLVLSDCEDWRPDNTGSKKFVNAQTWASLTYRWPVVPDGIIEAQYYIYWMQNIPGHQNAIRMGNEVMRNWWEFTADWDAAHLRSAGLHKKPEVRLTTESNGASDGEMGVRMIGDAGFGYVLRTSPDLVEWADLEAGPSFSGDLWRTVPPSADGDRRFYKAELRP